MMQVKAFRRAGDPVISVDTKKKELVGAFKNRGRRWLPKGKADRVSVHDFPHLGKGNAIPVQVSKLSIAVRVLGPSRVHIRLQGVPHDLQTTAHCDAADWVPRPGQLFGNPPSSLASPPQRTHRIAGGGLFDYALEPTWQPRIGLLHFLPPAAGLTYTSVGGCP